MDYPNAKEMTEKTVNAIKNLKTAEIERVKYFIRKNNIMEKIVNAAGDGQFYFEFQYAESEIQELKDFFEDLGYIFNYKRPRSGDASVSISWGDTSNVKHY